MNILAIETVTECCSVSLTLDGQTHQSIKEDVLAHSNFVLQMVNDLCSGNGVELDQLDAIAVDIGPGSFTGVRIGLGVAQGLAYGADLPVIGVNSLEAFVLLYPDSLVVPALDARMGQVYTGLYDTNSGCSVLHGPVVCDPGDLPFARDAMDVGDEYPVHGVGSGWAVYPDQLASAFTVENGREHPQERLKIDSTSRLEARLVARAALMKGVESAISPLAVTATYVRNQVANVVKPNDVNG